MNKYLILAALALVPLTAAAQSNYQATTSPSSPPRATATPASSVASPTPDGQEAQLDYFIKLPGVEGESDDPTPTPKPQNAPAPGVEPDEIDYDGDDEAERKESKEKGGTEDINIGVGELQEGESIDPDVIDYDGDPLPLTPDFSILLGGGSGGEDDEALEPVREAVAEIITAAGKGSDDAPLEEVAFYYNKISVRTTHKIKLFGFIPVTTAPTADVDAEGRVKVKFPWWAFLASGKDEAGLGERVHATLSDILDAQHDAIADVLGGR